MLVCMALVEGHCAVSRDKPGASTRAVAYLKQYNKKQPKTSSPGLRKTSAFANGKVGGLALAFVACSKNGPCSITAVGSYQDLLHQGDWKLLPHRTPMLHLVNY
jgi:hypothetical protein